MTALTHDQNMELRFGLAVGTPTIGDMPRPLGEGKHVNWSIRVRQGGDQWVMMIKDQRGEPRHALPETTMMPPGTRFMEMKCLFWYKGNNHGELVAQPSFRPVR